MLQKLRNVYFTNTTNVDAIQGGNIALLTDMYFGDSTLKATVHQANANNNEGKNTFLMRYKSNR